MVILKILSMHLTFRTTMVKKKRIKLPASNKMMLSKKAHLTIMMIIENQLIRSRVMGPYTNTNLKETLQTQTTKQEIPFHKSKVSKSKLSQLLTEQLCITLRMKMVTMRIQLLENQDHPLHGPRLTSTLSIIQIPSMKIPLSNSQLKNP
jgi:hypothetical protein